MEIFANKAETFRLKVLKEDSSVVMKKDEPMSAHTSFRAGGKAALLAEAKDKAQLKLLLSAACETGVPHIILGNGSNTLFRDEGYDGVVIRLAFDGFAGVRFDAAAASGSCGQASATDTAAAGGSAQNSAAAGQKVTAVCGTAVLLSSLAKIFLLEELTGFEFASGIPGSLGGALFMNAGAYGGEMKQIVKWVRAVSPDGLGEKVFTAEEMDFGYRHSALQENGYIAVEAALELEKGDRESISALMRELAEKRNSKQPVNYPSAGSTFKRPEGHFAGKLIEDAGLKGVSIGGAEVSTLHSGFIINKDKASASDILELIALVQNRVYDKFGIMLEPEVRIIG